MSPVVLFFNPAWAQSPEQWDWKVAPYLWTVGIDTTFYGLVIGYEFN